MTAGNSSQIVDGAAAVLIASERKASELGLEPRGRFLSFGSRGWIHRMLHGNPQACERALAKAGLGWDDVGVIEVNRRSPRSCPFVADAGLGDRLADVNPTAAGFSRPPARRDGRADHGDALDELERRGALRDRDVCIGFARRSPA